jgi:metal-responsive CopG/Arc/MetJ family transcriptional regulator
MKASLVLDEETGNELDELSRIEDKSKSEIVREAIKDLYLKEKRARENMRFFIELYSKRAITKDMLFTLLPRKEAENIIIGTKVGKDAAKLAKDLGY